MSTVIKVENLCKKYFVARRSSANRPTLREKIIEGIKSPFFKLVNQKKNEEIFWALKDINFEIKAGEVVGLVGHNGAGKSTFLKILARIIYPTSGGVDVYGRTGSLLELGTGFHPDLSGRENIYLNGVILGMKHQEIKRKFDEIVSFAEIDKFLDMPVKQYSTGMYLRLAFAVAAHLDSEVLLLDEVLAVGDAAFQDKCLKKMKEVSEQGRTILFVSHNMSAVRQMCNRVLLLESGKLIEDGAASEITARYLSEASSKEIGDFDLKNHSARKSSKIPVIKRLKLYANNVPTIKFSPEDIMVVEIFIDPETIITEPRIAISIEDDTGRRITTAATHFQDSPVGAIDSLSRIRCTFPPLRLGSGKYQLSVSIGNKRDGTIEELRRAAWFEVVWQDNFGNGEPFSLNYGPVLTRSVWESLD